MSEREGSGREKGDSCPCAGERLAVWGGEEVKVLWKSILGII